MSLYPFSEMPNPLIKEPPDKDLSIVVCIPCFNENNVVNAIRSLESADLNNLKAECIVLINTPIDAKSDIQEQNVISFKELSNLNIKGNLSVYPIHIYDIPIKNAGVGLARKMAMDEAVTRLSESEPKIKVIACFDADCTCAENYFTALYTHFQNSDKEAVSIYMEHAGADINGNDNQKAIYLYELHLRYFIQYQRELLLPFAFHTIGSSMACTPIGYNRIGGMNKRKAGEDFYFLHKFIKDDQCSYSTETTVYPSERSSDRVPFGTGKAVGDMLERNVEYLTYSPLSFEMFRPFAISIDSFFTNEYQHVTKHFSEPLISFLETVEFQNQIEKIKANTSSLARFKKGVFQFFNAFIFMKYLHFMRDNYYPNIHVQEASQELLDKLEIIVKEDLLRTFRGLDKKQ